MNQNILGGQIDMGAGSVALLLPQVKSGKMRAIATAGEKRAAALPDVPTLIEQGFPRADGLCLVGHLRARRHAQAIIDKFHAELVKVLVAAGRAQDALARRLGMDLVVSSPEELQKWTLEQLARWGKIVKDNGIKID